MLNTHSPNQFYFTERPNDGFWEDFDSSILSKREDIIVRISGSLTRWGNTEFLEKLSNLTMLEFDTYEVLNLNFLSNLRKLRKLCDEISTSWF